MDDNSFAIRGRRKATPPVASSTNKRKPGANIGTCTNVGSKKFGGEKLYSHLGLMAFVVLKSFGSLEKRNFKNVEKSLLFVFRSIYLARISRFDKEETVRKIISKYYRYLSIIILDE